MTAPPDLVRYYGLRPDRWTLNLRGDWLGFERWFLPGQLDVGPSVMWIPCNISKDVLELGRRDVTRAWLASELRKYRNPLPHIKTISWWQRWTRS